MGGVFGILSLTGENIVGFAIGRLRLLEFRGFDGSGLAVLSSNGRITVYKDALRVEKLVERYNLGSIASSVALGHTRYATHGKPHALNTQPHVDCTGSIAVVGDGAIADYEALRDEMILRGHNVASKCDFEVVAHLIEERVGMGQDYKRAVAEVLRSLEGFYSLAILDAARRTFVLYRRGPSLYIGLSRNLVAVSSSLYALHGLSDRYIELEDGEAVFIDIDRGGIDSTSPYIESRITPLSVDTRYIDRDGYPHHMLREIYEIPQALLRTVYSVQKRFLSLAARLLKEADKVFIIGNGSSLHAGYIASYYMSEIAGISPIVVSATEFPLYNVDTVGPGTVVIAISQSGQSVDVLSAVYEAKLRGATVLALTNFIGSRLASMSNLYLPIGAGPELAVPATKSFTSTLLLLYMLSLELGRQLGRVQDSDLRLALDSVKRLSSDLSERMSVLEHLAGEAAKALARCRSGYVVSRGLTYPLALEGALKFKEVAYVHAEGVEAGEYRHGPQALLEEGFFTVFIMPVEKAALEATYSLIDIAIEKGSIAVVIGFEYDKRLAYLSDRAIKIAAVQTERHLAPIALAVPVYLTVYKLGVLLGRPIDSPRYLTKIVQ